MYEEDPGDEVDSEPDPGHSRPQSHFHSVTRWKLGSGLHDQMERSDWLLREPANYHAH